jgi:dTDP-4-dehydrorhamnose 3,5-epimerase
MNIISIPLKDAFIIETGLIKDKRGSFARFFCFEELIEINKGNNIKQINYSMTKKKGSIRGLHFQYPPKSEIKMVRCLKGKVFDVIVDLRKSSKTFLKWHGEILSEENMKMVYIPIGFAHGFQSLTGNCEMLYLHSEYYSSQHEGGIRYNDSKVNITWPLLLTEISDKDKTYSLLEEDFKGL